MGLISYWSRYILTLASRKRVNNFIGVFSNHVVQMLKIVIEIGTRANNSAFEPIKQ